MSANTGTAPASVIACATWCQVCDAQITSSPAPIPIARNAIQVASVPLATATACARPTQPANARSNESSIGPSLQRDDCSTALTKSISRAAQAGSLSAISSISMRLVLGQDQSVGLFGPLRDRHTMPVRHQEVDAARTEPQRRRLVAHVHGADAHRAHFGITLVPLHRGVA